MKLRWCQYWFHRPRVRGCYTPNTSNRRCQGWRRCGMIQQTPQRPFGLCRGQSLWMKVHWCSCWFHHPTVRSCSIPSTSVRCCQGWCRCGMLQQTPQRPFGPCRGQSLWMEVHRCPCWFHRPTVRSCCAPNTSGRRCQEWRRSGIFQLTACRSYKQLQSQTHPSPSPMIPR